MDDEGALLDYIAQRQYLAGPTMREVARATNLSVATVHARMRRLTARGRLRRSRNGSYVIVETAAAYQ